MDESYKPTKKSLLHIGQKYGRLTVTEIIGRDSHKNRIVKATCQCGYIGEYRLPKLLSGNTRSCGCLRKENTALYNSVHGLAYKLSEYTVWKGMKQRCFNPNSKNYPDYGGRGITVCEEWRNDFVTFLLDVGVRPSPEHSLDRIDNDGSYEPGNVRWATYNEQANNRRPKRTSK